MGKHKSRRNRFPCFKLFIAVATIASALAVIWTGYLLYTQKLENVTAIIILTIAIAALVWNGLLLSRYRVKSGVVFAAFVVTAMLGATVLAFSGVEPFVGAKSELSCGAQNLGNLIFKKLPIDISSEIQESKTVGIWRISLNSVHWNGSDAIVRLTVTHVGEKPAYFGCGERYVDQFGLESFWIQLGMPPHCVRQLCVIDSCNMLYEHESEDIWGRNFYNIGIYYPGENRSGTLKFSVNPRSGEVLLYMSEFSPELKPRVWKVSLFSLGSP